MMVLARLFLFFKWTRKERNIDDRRKGKEKIETGVCFSTAPFAPWERVFHTSAHKYISAELTWTFL